MSEYDVVVVGAGPGGSTAAKSCAEEGLNVLIVEKRQEIGAPVRCAEGVSKSELASLVEIKKRWIAAEVAGAKVYSPDNTVITLSAEQAGNEVGYILERKIFDRWLAKQAAKAGADILVKTAAIGIEKDGEALKIKLRRAGEFFDVTAKIVIGADGVESRVGKWMGIDTTLKLNEIESCVQYLMTGLDEKYDMDYCHFWLGHSRCPGGYIWLFPKGNGSANFGIGVMPSMAKETAKYYLDRFLEAEGIGMSKVVEVVAGGVPVSPMEKISAERCLLVGDAARHADPITGGGIINAMRGGKIAGKVAAEAVRKNDFSARFLSRYDKLCKEDFGKTLERNKILQKKILKMKDETLNNLAKSLEGYRMEDMSVTGIVKELIKRNPKIFWDLKSLFL
jgi:digeranylgeranylglycerophospholipid reductase